jgi:4-hydroxythreonine-4-phosphate dehydrogenase
MGDPVGVGPEVVIRAVRSSKVARAARCVVVGDAGVLERVARKIKVKLPKSVEVIPVSTLVAAKLLPGRPTIATGKAMINYIDEAVRLIKDGAADALATAPITKEAARKAGFKFPGHTEYLAHLTNTKDFVMMLGGDRLKVVLVTIHEPIKKVPRLVTKAKVLKTIKITDAAFRRDFGIKRPRIAVAGLNPHAGEGGLMGGEDASIIAPAVRAAKKAGINVTGPLPADTVFYRASKGDFDCVVCMYHDQGLGPMKLLHFDDGINATLGLPIIRTSVDHGTAYDIAWKGVANHASMVNAIVTAADMARRRSKK